MSTLMHIVEEFTIDLEFDRGGARAREKARTRRG
jgi:hypothetical protein